jgi:hypothetical protein
LSGGLSRPIPVWHLGDSEGDRRKALNRSAFPPLSVATSHRGR